MSHIQRAWTDAGSVAARSRVLPLSVLVVGLLVTLALAVSSAYSARARALEDFEAEALGASVLVTDTFEQPLQTLDAIAALHAASGGLQRDGFENFAESLIAGEPAVAMLEWAPRVPGGERAAFEQVARDEGLEGFVIAEPNPDGELVPVTTRAEHYPLLYIHPPSPDALGLDLLAEESRRNLVYRTVESDATVASAPFSLVEDPPDRLSVAVYRPVVDRNGLPIGLAIAVVRLDDALEHPALLRLLADGDVEVGIVSRGGDAGTIVETRGFSEASGEERSFEYDYAGQPWEVIVRSADPVRLGFAPWLVVLLGVLLSLFAARATDALARVNELTQQVEDANEIGQYRLLDKLGEGGMGVVYRATHALLQRPTAIKMISGAISETDLKRFEREVRLTARLRHPNSIEVYDYGRTAKGLFYFAMEYLDGMTLRQLVKRHGTLNDGRVVHILRQVLGALTEAHEVGIVHRDLKPENIMISHRYGWPDFVSVLDFGLAKPMKTPEGEVSLTAGDVILGTPHYISPEQVTGKPLDGRADLYALGCITFFLLTGSAPFKAKSSVELCIAHVEKAPPTIAERTGGPVGADLEAFVARSIAKRPNDRFADAREMRRALDLLTVEHPWTDTDAEDWWVSRDLEETVAANR